jgi:hypothetical protein
MARKALRSRRKMWSVPLGDCTGDVVGSEVMGSVTILSSFSDVVFRLVFNRQAPLNQILERLVREPSTLQVFA